MPPKAGVWSAGSGSTAPTPSAGWPATTSPPTGRWACAASSICVTPSRSRRPDACRKATAPHYQNLPIEGRRWELTPYNEEVGIARYLADRYLEITEDGVANLRTALETVAAADNAPVVVHCAAGKDRTGVLTALVLSLVGVDEDDIVADYALTGRATERFIADWRRRHPDTPLWPGFGLAPAETMRLFLTDLTARHGSIERYVTQVLQLSPDAVAELRAHLLTESNGAG
ncbi:hypothetical protein GCM10020001_045240 [Nonomuraea salmonea]